MPPNLPARLRPTPLSSAAANLLHSVTYDAHRLGGAAGHDQISECYAHLHDSRQKFVEYVSRLEARLHIPQEQFFRFD